MPTTMRLTVIIPHLNEPEDLGRCIQALVSQRQDSIPFEIIVVDNGSHVMPDITCKGIADLRLVRQTDPGPGPARNLGASLARAELLAFIDADCVAQPGWVGAIVNAMERQPHLAFIGGDIRITPVDPARPSAIECYESVYAYNARAYVEQHGFAATGNMAVRKSVFETVGPFGGILTMEDTDWGRRATSRGFKGAYLADARVLTPSCRSFAELALRWDRHVAHEFRAIGRGRPRRLIRWLIKSAAIATSPSIESVRIITTGRLRGARNRMLAWLCLTRVRLYRARRMLRVAFEGDASRLVQNWNRTEP